MLSFALLGGSASAQSLVNGIWKGLTISSDGNRLAAVGDIYDNGRGMYVGSLYTSGNGASTWQYNAAFGDHNFTSLAGSSSGLTLLAATDNGLFMSMDAGGSWAATFVRASWLAAAVSSNGGVLVASGYNYTTGYSNIWYSANGGTSWRATSVRYYVNSLLLSANGSIVVALGNSQLLVSTDSGATYTDTTTPAGFAVISASGNTIAAFRYVNATATQIRVSTDLGKTFGSPTVINTTYYGQFTGAAVMSADGSRIGASTVGGTAGGTTGAGTFFVSANSGASWAAMSLPVYYFSCIAGTADAMTILGGGGGSMYLSRDGGTMWFSTGMVTTRSLSATPSSGISPTSSWSTTATRTPAATPVHTNGASCYADYDCASGICNQGICSPPPPSVACESEHARV